MNKELFYDRISRLQKFVAWNAPQPIQDSAAYQVLKSVLGDRSPLWFIVSETATKYRICLDVGIKMFFWRRVLGLSQEQIEKRILLEK